MNPLLQPFCLANTSLLLGLCHLPAEMKDNEICSLYALFLYLLLLGARVAQYCGRCVHTKITSHPAWGKADYPKALLNIS